MASNFEFTLFKVSDKTEFVVDFHVYHMLHILPKMIHLQIT